MNVDRFHTAAVRLASWEIELRALVDDTPRDTLGIQIAKAQTVTALEEMLAAYRERPNNG